MRQNPNISNKRMLSSIAIFMLGLVGLYHFAHHLPFDAEKYWWIAILIFYFGWHLIPTLIDAVQGNFTFSFSNFLALWVIHSLDTLIELAFIAYIFPLIALNILLGPFMGLLCIVSFVMLGFYFIEDILGFNLKGSSFDNAQQALIALLVFLGSSAFIYYFHIVKNGEEQLEDWAINGFIKRINEPWNRVKAKQVKRIGGRIDNESN